MLDCALHLSGCSTQCVGQRRRVRMAMCGLRLNNTTVEECRDSAFSTDELASQHRFLMSQHITLNTGPVTTHYVRDRTTPLPCVSSNPRIVPHHLPALQPRHSPPHSVLSAAARNTAAACTMAAAQCATMGQAHRGQHVGKRLNTQVCSASTLPTCTLLLVLGISTYCSASMSTSLASGSPWAQRPLDASTPLPGDPTAYKHGRCGLHSLHRCKQHPACAWTGAPRGRAWRSSKTSASCCSMRHPMPKGRRCTLMRSQQWPSTPPAATQTPCWARALPAALHTKWRSSCEGGSTGAAVAAAGAWPAALQVCHHVMPACVTSDADA